MGCALLSVSQKNVIRWTPKTGPYQNIAMYVACDKCVSVKGHCMRGGVEAY